MTNFNSLISSITQDSKQIIKTIKKKEFKRKILIKLFNVPIPRFCIFSVTWECNLTCTGCYAMGYNQKRNLKDQEIEHIIKELSKYGTYIFIIAGGEPFTIENLSTILYKNSKSLFIIFTNGTLISEKDISLFKKAKNILTIISLEGDKTFTDSRRGAGVYDKIINTIDKLNKNKIPFGFSATLSSANIKKILADNWLEKMKSFGAKMGFLIDYIPLNHDENNSMEILTDDDLIFKKSFINTYNQNNDFYLINFPADEYIDAKCQSAGKNLIHINANGLVEPCPFSHWAKDSILKKNYIKILKSTFLTEIRNSCEKLEFNKTCLLFENKDMVMKIAMKNQAKKTDEQNV